MNWKLFWCIVVANFSAFHEVSAVFDLYVDAKEFKKLLGVQSELWYVKDGDVKQNALQYVLLVPASVNILHFHWRARHNSTLQYKMNAVVGNPEAAEISLNVSQTGKVPRSLETFSLTINCTGKLTTQVDVTLTLEIPLQTSLLHHLTNLTIQRRKICFRGGEAGNNTSVVMSMLSVRSASAVVYATVGCLAVFLIVVAVLAAYSHRRHINKATHRHAVNGCEGRGMHLQTVPCLPNNSSSTAPSTVAAQHGLGAYLQNPRMPISLLQSSQAVCRSASRAGSSEGPVAASSQRTLATGCSSAMPGLPLLGTEGIIGDEEILNFIDSRQGDSTAKLRSILVPWASPSHEAGASRTSVSSGDGYGSGSTVKLLDCLLEGTFGRLYDGLYTPPALAARQSEEPIAVTVKTIAAHSSSGQRDLFLREAVMLVGVEHMNLQRVLAVTMPHDQPPMVLYHRTQHGNMKRFLQSCGPLVTREVVTMGVQVLQALSYLHSVRLLHCDVATRNCIVDASLHVKLGDCALSRDLFPGDYHCLGDNNNRPVKWLALEALLHNTFSPQSDVWSWGVLLWEIMTLGQQPYAEIDPFEMEDTLMRGIRLAQPINCPDEMFQAMTYCWTNSPLERPTVSELIEYLSGFLLHLDRFV